MCGNANRAPYISSEGELPTERNIAQTCLRQRASGAGKSERYRKIECRTLFFYLSRSEVHEDLPACIYSGTFKS
jgi:hypothetical protein